MIEKVRAGLAFSGGRFARAAESVLTRCDYRKLAGFFSVAFIVAWIRNHRWMAVKTAANGALKVAVKIGVVSKLTLVAVFVEFVFLLSKVVSLSRQVWRKEISALKATEQILREVTLLLGNLLSGVVTMIGCNLLAGRALASAVAAIPVIGLHLATVGRAVLGMVGSIESLMFGNALPAVVAAIPLVGSSLGRDLSRVSISKILAVLGQIGRSFERFPIVGCAFDAACDASRGVFSKIIAILRYIVCKCEEMPVVGPYVETWTSDGFRWLGGKVAGNALYRKLRWIRRNLSRAAKEIFIAIGEASVKIERLVKGVLSLSKRFFRQFVRRKEHGKKS